MLIKLLADSDSSARIRLDRRDARGRRCRLTAEDALHDPGSADDRRSRGTVGGDLKNGRLGHETTTHTILWQSNLTQLSAHDGGELIKVRQALIDENEIGVDDVLDGKIAAHEFSESLVTFIPCRFQEMVIQVIIRIKIGIRVIGSRLTQVQPVIRKRIDETTTALVRQQPLRLG